MEKKMKKKIAEMVADSIISRRCYKMGLKYESCCIYNKDTGIEQLIIGEDRVKLLDWTEKMLKLYRNLQDIIDDQKIIRFIIQNLEINSFNSLIRTLVFNFEYLQTHKCINFGINNHSLVIIDRMFIILDHKKVFVPKGISQELICRKIANEFDNADSIDEVYVYVSDDLFKIWDSKEENQLYFYEWMGSFINETSDILNNKLTKNMIEMYTRLYQLYTIERKVFG